MKKIQFGIFALILLSFTTPKVEAGLLEKLKESRAKFKEEKRKRAESKKEGERRASSPIRHAPAEEAVAQEVLIPARSLSEFEKLLRAELMLDKQSVVSHWLRLETLEEVDKRHESFADAWSYYIAQSDSPAAGHQKSDGEQELIQAVYGMLAVANCEDPHRTNAMNAYAKFINLQESTPKDAKKLKHIAWSALLMFGDIASYGGFDEYEALRNAITKELSRVPNSNFDDLIVKMKTQKGIQASKGQALDPHCNKNVLAHASTFVESLGAPEEPYAYAAALSNEDGVTEQPRLSLPAPPAQQPEPRATPLVETSDHRVPEPVPSLQDLISQERERSGEREPSNDSALRPLIQPKNRIPGPEGLIRQERLRLEADQERLGN